MDSNVIYEIEGDIDFFKELKNITTKPSDMNTPLLTLNIEDKPVEKCLISDEVLRKDHITLKCGHKFNYVPLFKEVVFQKCSMLPKNVSAKVVTMYITNTPDSAAPTQSANVSTVMYNSSYNLETTKVNYNEMKCPYCREITPQILPYYPYPDVSKIKYVNSPVDLGISALTCEYNNTVDGTTKCRTNCVYHEKYNMMLCNRHFNKLETTYDESDNDVSKSTTRRTTRKTATKSTSNADDKNIIISHNNPATSVCSFMLLSGPRKGCPCGKPMWIPKMLVSSNLGSEAPQAAYCKVHYEKYIK